MSAHRWHFAIGFSPSNRRAPDRAAFFSDGTLTIEADNAHPSPRRYQFDGRECFLFGHPIADARRDDRAVLATLGQNRDAAAAFRALNGSFVILLYDGEKRALTIANDRFAAFSLHFFRDGQRWQASSSLKWLWDRGGSARGIDEIAATQFLFVRRLFGERTLANGIRFLRPASILCIGPDGTETEEQYWRPDFTKTAPNDRDLPALIADGLRNAVAAHRSDGGRHGLLLSGGLDSRALLAAAPERIACYTTCLRENNESAVAQAVATAVGAPFHFVPRPVDLYDWIVDDATFLTGGQQDFTEAQFLGYANRWPELPQTMLIGLGLDILFGGLYLPKAPITLFGRPTLHYRLKPIVGDLATAFLHGVSYRLKQSDPMRVIKPVHRNTVRDRLIESINAVVERGRALGAEGYRLWEYMHMDVLSRHYSFPMMLSVRSYAECRAPALDNALFDLSIRMTAQQKVNGSAYQRAIGLLSPVLGKIRNANTNLPAVMPLPQQTIIKAARFAANRMFGSAYPASPGREDRSWPSARDSLAAAPLVLERVREMPCSERLAMIAFVDMDGVRTVVADHLEGKADHAVLLNLLVTLDSFMRAPAGAGG